MAFDSTDIQSPPATYVVEIDHHRIAREARKAYDAGLLQAQLSPGIGCSYSAGCAIGVGLDRYDREYLDDGRGNFRSLLDESKVSVEDEMIECLLVNLQQAHDSLSMENHNRPGSPQQKDADVWFKRRLKDLETYCEANP